MLNMKKLFTKILTSFVNKAGDTMTGRLTSKNALDTTTGTTGYNIAWQGTDKDDLEMGQLTPTIDSAGNSGLTVEGVRVINGASRYNSLRLYLNGSGEPVVGVTSPKAWVNALGVNAITGNSSSLSNPVTSLPTAAWKRIGNISVGAGKWLIIFHVTFSANGNGRREIRLCTNGNDDYSGIVNLMCKDNRIAAPAACESVCTFTMVLDTAATITYYLKAAQDSGSTLTVTARFSAIKLC